jgi:uncharacterized protein YodC (DUF2158 family)
MGPYGGRYGKKEEKMGQIEFSASDVVQVKSGGPKMTVFAVVPAVTASPATTVKSPPGPMGEVVDIDVPAVAASEAQASCVWYNTADEVRSGNYFFTLLRHVGDAFSG